MYWVVLAVLLLANLALTSAQRVCPEMAYVERCSVWGQFRCTSGECVDGVSCCDGSPDCADSSDETHCDTCNATHTIANQIEQGDLYSSCYVDGGYLLPGFCDRLRCYDGSSDDGLVWTILPCHNPPAIHLLQQTGDIFLPYLDHTFTKTESLSVLVQGKISIVTVTLTHLAGAIGIQEDVTRDGNTSTWIPYTEIPIDTSHCTGGETGNADTCNALQTIVNQLKYYRAYGTCTKDSACGVIECKGVTDLRLTLLPCHSPPAVQLQVAFQGSTELDRTFTATGAASVVTEGVKRVIKVTLDHPDGDTILLRVDMLQGTGYDYDFEHDFPYPAYPFIPYTVIPLDTTDCPDQPTAETDGTGQPTGGTDGTSQPTGGTDGTGPPTGVTPSTGPPTGGTDGTGQPDGSGNIDDKCDCPDSGDRDNLGRQSDDEDSDGVVVGLAVGLPLLVLCCVCASILVGVVVAVLYRRRRGSTDIAMDPLKDNE